MPIVRPPLSIICIRLFLRLEHPGFFTGMTSHLQTSSGTPGIAPGSRSGARGQENYAETSLDSHEFAQALWVYPGCPSWARPIRSLRRGHTRDRRFRCEQALTSVCPVEIVQIRRLSLSRFAVASCLTNRRGAQCLRLHRVTQQRGSRRVSGVRAPWCMGLGNGLLP